MKQKLEDKMPGPNEPKLRPGSPVTVWIMMPIKGTFVKTLPHGVEIRDTTGAPRMFYEDNIHSVEHRPRRNHNVKKQK